LLAMDVNDDAGCLDNAASGRFSRAGSLLQGIGFTRFEIVGASLLAMDVNDDAGCLDKRGVWTFFASRLAPTGDRVYTV